MGMSEIKWIKISTEIFDDEKMKLIDAMSDRDTIFYIWVRLLVQAGKVNNNGYVYLSADTSYNEEMLSTIFNRSLSAIRTAFKVLEDFKMIEILEDKKIRIVNWDKHQNVEGMERAREQSKLRMRRKRERDRQKLNEVNEKLKENVTNSNSNVTDSNSSVTVTTQIEKENKSNNETIKTKNNKDVNKIEISNLDIITQQAKEIQNYYESLSGESNTLNLSSIKVAIAQHSAQYVKLAIEKSIQVNKMNMRYINGILKNWKKEGYPKVESEVDGRESCISNGTEVTEFKPKAPRRISQEERENTEGKLI